MQSRVSTHQSFYFPPGSSAEGVVRFGADDSKHMLRSLRLGAGDVVTATDGTGKVYTVAIEQAKRGRVTGRITSCRMVPPPSPRIWLFQAMIRPARMDQLVEQCVELGIAGLAPVACERTLRHVGGNRLTRWRRIAVEAMKQSLQSHLAEIRRPETFESAARLMPQYDLVLVACEIGAPAFCDALSGRDKPESVAVWVGPEGGFAGHELKTLTDARGVVFSLGLHRLRSETAAVAAVALLVEQFR